MPSTFPAVLARRDCDNCLFMLQIIIGAIQTALVAIHSTQILVKIFRVIATVKAGSRGLSKVPWPAKLSAAASQFPPQSSGRD